ncbi:amidohydrolase family protein [Halalkalibacter nanhaiisediminis]|uniref:Putative TIM-barrel fold metal-dependent hydrolase n=1 Tax=Halalkalibacter nanhaiisediminis TaxID=688079 RepID=A0A562QR06_9BACI|nr:amidohydrolase family protein [Halalkalibacter nanhaiisediminis]TWI59103.1 putative TIM-barrel fold metal-dependent hydrolase [Halalkalibacter nanhaiisediminis]
MNFIKQDNMPRYVSSNEHQGSPTKMAFGRKVISAHSHVGYLEPWAFYESKELISPMDPAPETTEELLSFMNARGIEKSLVMPNYGVPKQEQPFSHNQLIVQMAREGKGRIAGALWVSGLAQNAERNETAFRMLDEPGIRALKMSYLLGGTPNPKKWDLETLQLHEKILKEARERDIPIHFHTGSGGSSDITEYFELIKRYGKENKIHLVHMGGGTSGHIRLITHWKDLIEGGYQIYVDSSWAIGFGPRKLLQEIDKTGVGVDRFLFGCDEPWSDFESEFWKIQGVNVSDEIKERVFWGNAEEQYFS